jgi:hypothetical protein
VFFFIHYSFVISLLFWRKGWWGWWWFVLAGWLSVFGVVCVFAGGVPGVFAVGEFDAMFMRVFSSCTTKE